MPRKIIWIDTETTGTNPRKNALIELAFLLEIDGQLKIQAKLNARPRDNEEINQKALKIHGLSEEDLRSFDSPEMALIAFKDFLKPYVNLYDRSDKLTIAGYFVRFDVDFLRQFFTKCDDKYFGSWFKSVTLDVQHLVAEKYSYTNEVPQNFKLQTICEREGVHLTRAHEALADIQATRELYYKLREDIGRYYAQDD